MPSRDPIVIPHYDPAFSPYFDPDIDIGRFLDPSSKLLFYPSSGTDCDWLANSPYGVFVFADKYPYNPQQKDEFWNEFRGKLGPQATLIAGTTSARVFELAGKLGFLFFEDNRRVLNAIKDSGKDISAFVGVCDGCREGGNYECVNDPAFLRKVGSIMHPDGMVYITDHSRLLYPGPTWQASYNRFHREFILDNKVFRCCFSEIDSVENAVVRCPYGEERGFYGPKREYRVSLHFPVVYEWCSETLRVTIEHDSIANNLWQIDGAVISERCRWLCETVDPHRAKTLPMEIVRAEYFKPSRYRKNAVDSLRKLLETALTKRWNTVGTTAFGEGDHSKFIKVFTSWKQKFPTWIRIFHFDSEDFCELKKMFRKIDRAGPEWERGLARWRGT